MDGITLQAIFNKATTTVDGGWRVSFDVNPSEVKKIAMLSVLRETLLELKITPVTEGEIVE